MTPEQIAVIGLIVVMFALFAWNKWRYDVVAVLGLSSLVVLDAVLGGAANQIWSRIPAGFWAGLDIRFRSRGPASQSKHSLT
jgi:hypothetical protein